jgi:hypothetical protein
MKRSLLLGALLFGVLLLAMVLLAPQLPLARAAPLAAPPTPMPTTMYDHPGPPGDKVSRIYGGYYQEDIGTLKSLYVGDDLYVTDDALVGGDLTVTGALAYGTAITNGVIGGDLTVSGRLTTTTGLGGVVNADNIMLPSIATKVVNWTAATGYTGTVLSMPEGSLYLIHGVLISLTNNFDCTGDDCVMQVGDGNDVDGFIVLADAELQVADTEGTGFAAGWEGMSAATLGAYLQGTNYNLQSFVYNNTSAETIDVYLNETTGNTFSAGKATIYVIYTRIR